MSLQKQATAFLAVLVGAVLVRNAAVAIIQSQGNDAQARAQSAQLLETHEKQFAIGLLNQETGERGFELTGDSQYLQPYQLGTSQTTEARHFLDTASTDLPTRAKLVVMESAASKWQAFSPRRVWLRSPQLVRAPAPIPIKTGSASSMHFGQRSQT